MKVLPASAKYPYPTDVTSRGLTLIKHANDVRPSVIVLVHGLKGRPLETWGRFPELLFNDERLASYYDIALYAYPTAVIRNPLNFAHLTNVPTKGIVFADNLQNELINSCSYQNITLLCHSEGGLLSQRAIIHLLQLRERTKQPLPIQALIFLATPLFGSPLVTGWRASWSHDMRALAALGEESGQLQSEWNELVEPIDLPTKRRQKPYQLPVRAIIASQDIASTRFGSSVGIPRNLQHYVARTHTEVCKPVDENDEVFTYVRNQLLHINNLLPVAQSSGSTSSSHTSVATTQRTIPETNIQDVVLPLDNVSHGIRMPRIITALGVLVLVIIGAWLLSTSPKFWLSISGWPSASTMASSQPIPSGSSALTNASPTTKDDSSQPKIVGLVITTNRLTYQIPAQAHEAITVAPNQILILKVVLSGSPSTETISCAWNRKTQIKGHVTPADNCTTSYVAPNSTGREVITVSIFQGGQQVDVKQIDSGSIVINVETQ